MTLQNYQVALLCALTETWKLMPQWTSKDYQNVQVEFNKTDLAKLFFSPYLVHITPMTEVKCGKKTRQSMLEICRSINSQ